MTVNLGRLRFNFRLTRGLRLAVQIGDERVALVHELALRATVVFGSDRVFAEQRKRYRRIAVGDDGIGQDAGIDLAPADRFGRRRAADSPPQTTWSVVIWMKKSLPPLGMP